MKYMIHLYCILPSSIWCIVRARMGERTNYCVLFKLLKLNPICLIFYINKNKLS